MEEWRLTDSEIEDAVKYGPPPDKNNKWRSYRAVANAQSHKIWRYLYFKADDELLD